MGQSALEFPRFVLDIIPNSDQRKACTETSASILNSAL